MANSANLDLWGVVEKTPTSQTKPITGKAYRGTSPKPYYLVHKATETFGPCGIGWGFEIVDEKILEGAMLAPGFFAKIHMARVRVWYEWAGKRGTVEHVGQTEFSGRRRDGTPFTDEDAPKKSVTDALVKALSMIGFAGDIFMGRYDDSKYVSELRQEEQETERDTAAASRSTSPAATGRPGATRREDPLAHMTRFTTALENCDTEQEVRSLWVREKQAREAAGLTEAQRGDLSGKCAARINNLRDNTNYLAAGE